MAGRLQDRVAVITGAGSGIGLATARRFAAEGASVVVADVDDGRGQAARPTRSAASSCRATSTTEDAGPRPVDDDVADTYGGVDIAFNNAGISPPDDDSILDTGLDAWRRVQEVNLTSVYLCCKYADPAHAARRAAARSSTPRRSSR